LKINSIGFVGLSHLGLNYLAASAEKGFKAIGFQEDINLINKLKKNKNIISEPGLTKLLIKNKKKITFTTKAKDLKKCDIIFISLDIPTNLKNKSNLKKINFYIKKIKKTVSKNTVIIILCQVPPGFTQKIKWPKKNLYYQVETLVFGNAVQRALKPERIIIGSKNKTSKVDKKYNFYLKKFKCPIFNMDYLSAELTKISINIFLASSITTTNSLAELCEKMGASWSNIYPAIQKDKRIGRFAYIKPGLGISGGNLERDLNTVNDIANKFKSDQQTFKNFIVNSQKRKNWIYEILNKIYIKKAKISDRIGILGLSYKENTDSIKNSPAINLIRKLKKKHISVYDPKVPNIYLGRNVTRFYEINKFLKNLDILIIATPWSEFKKIKINKLFKYIKKKIVIDPYQIFDKSQLIEKGFIYKTLGEK